MSLITTCPNQVFSCYKCSAMVANKILRHRESLGGGEALGVLSKRVRVVGDGGGGGHCEAPRAAHRIPKI